MKTKYYFLIYTLFFSNLLVFSQQGLQKRADSLFNKFSFVKASEVYEELINKQVNVNHSVRQLGDAYLYMRNPELASNYYQIAVEQDNVPIEYLYKYAQSLRGVKNYKESRKWMKKFKEAGGTITDDFSKDSDFISSINNAKQNYFLSNAKFNSELSDFGAFEYNNQVYFASTANPGVSSKHIYGWNEQPFLDIYAIDKDADTIIHHKSKVKGAINSTYHDGPLTISKDGNTMYFSRNGHSKNGLEKDKKGYSHLKIYKAILLDDKWTNIEELPFNSNEYSVGHPALNKDETKLYFASDMPGGSGGSDIYVVDINPDGSYSEPKNMGGIINTDKNELFPFINSEDILFFSSDGHLGLGLLDIFASVKDKNNEIINILNLGSPVNSNKDDFSFYMSEDGLSGYLSSNRDGGKGDDDIYSYERIPELFVEGTVLNPENNTPIEGAIVTITNKNNEEIGISKTDKNGQYKIKIERDEDYTLSAIKDEYDDQSIPLSSKNIDKKISHINADVTMTLSSKKITIITQLYPIYFDYNKHDIRQDSTKELDRIVNLMLNEYPNMIIKIESYSDSRGAKAYNKKLSIERANSTYKYLISNGVSSNRITEYNGYGEENLVNNCDGTVACTEDEHQLNRRTLFIVVQME